MWFGGMSKKIKVFYIEKGLKPNFLKTKMFYSREEKKWYLKINKERIPTPENIFDLLYDNAIFVVRKSPNEYEFLNMNDPLQKTKINEFEKYTVPPEEIYSSLIKAEIRKERNKSAKEKILPIILVVIAMVGVGLFIAIAWSSTGEKMAAMAGSFDSAMARLENITKMQEETFSRLKCEIKPGGEILPMK